MFSTYVLFPNLTAKQARSSKNNAQMTAEAYTSFVSFSADIRYPELDRALLVRQGDSAEAEANQAKTSRGKSLSENGIF